MKIALNIRRLNNLPYALPFFTVILVHGLIHLIGFAKAFGLAELPQITKEISKIAGIIWLTTSLLFIVTAFSFILKRDWWWLLAVLVLASSQFLIYLNWKSSKYGTIDNVAILLPTLFGYASFSFKSSYQHEV